MSPKHTNVLSLFVKYAAGKKVNPSKVVLFWFCVLF